MKLSQGEVYTQKFMWRNSSLTEGSSIKCQGSFDFLKLMPGKKTGGLPLISPGSHIYHRTNFTRSFALNWFYPAG